MYESLNPVSEVDDMAKPKNATPATAASVQGGATPVNKAEKFRELMAALGDDAQPLQIVEEMKKRYGLAISPTVASAYKATYLRKKRQAANGSRKATAAASTGSQIEVEDVLAVRELVRRLGTDKLQQLAAAVK